MTRFLFIILTAALLSFGSAYADDWRSGSFVFTDWPGPPITIHYVEPDSVDTGDAPVVIVMHGVDRNADDYAANWRGLVAEHGFRVYAPEFSDADFPGAAMYNLGGIGTDGPYAYSAIEPLFTAIAERGGTAEGYYLFSHSAGAQFVHRAVLFEALPRLIMAFSANAGWYTLPDPATDWPYGLSGTSVDEAAIGAWLGRPLVVLLGDQDTDRRDPNLRRTAEAMAQGEHRYARGAFFMRTARDRAVELGVPFAWTAYNVPGVAHDNAGMAQAAALLIALDAEAAIGGED
ncbi:MULTISPECIES: alpha/beta hydrolase [Hyphobacterium]|uniref:Alpha/beta hydrolase n=1 Tax=Hyphobacterium vulgare TaxID=1736751 RepID=A0ABV7A189_9PROT